MAIKIMPDYGLFACRKDAALHGACAMALAFRPVVHASTVSNRARFLWRHMCDGALRVLLPHQDAEPPSSLR